MRLIGTKKSSRDADIEVYVISLGIEEVKLLYAMVEKSFRYTPKILETTATCGRLRDFMRELNIIIKNKYDKNTLKKF
jgi:endonuclease IV